MNDLDRTLLNRFLQQVPLDFFQTPRALIAVSGGSDSMALLVLCVLAQRQRLSHGGFPELVAVHVDHAWHDGSAAQACQVKQWAQTWGVDCRIQTLDPQPVQSGQGREASARNRRFAVLKQVAQQQGAGFVLLGHTQDDQVETVLMRIARGTGLDGLRGIPVARPLTPNCRLLRPLLDCTRQELRDFLAHAGQGFLEDPTNQDLTLTRNRVRARVLPWLREQLAVGIDRALLGLSQMAHEHQQLLEHLAQQHRSALLSLTPDRFQVDVRQLAGLPEPLVRALLVHWWGQTDLPRGQMNRSHWGRLSRLAWRPTLASDVILQEGEDQATEIPADRGKNKWPSRCHLPGPVLAIRSRGVLIVSKLPI